MKIHEYVIQQACTRPTSIALIDSNQSLSYQDLDARSNQLANYLHRLGVRPGDFIPILMQRSVQALTSILAVLKLGAVYVPLNTLISPIKLKEIVDLIGTRFLITDSAHLDKIDAYNKINIDLANYECMNQELNFSHNMDTKICYGVFTSGTTGAPKGILVSHQALEQTFLSWQKCFDLQLGEHHLQLANLGFDVFTGEWVRALCSGGTLVITPQAYILEPTQLYQYMQDNSVNTAEFVPAVLLRLTEHLKQTSQNLHFMKRVICGSDLITVKSFTGIYDLCGPTTRLINSYGLSEAVIDSTYFDYNETALAQLHEHSLVPIGRPFPHVKTYIVDDNLNEVTPGEEGELLIGGNALAEEYWNQPDLTQKRFPTLAAQGYGKVFRTGDRGYQLSDGNIVFLGRNDFIAKINGVRIELSAIEETLKEIPSIKDALVLVNQPDPTKEKTMLNAYMVITGVNLSAQQLVNHLQRMNFSKHEIPSNFYTVKEIPLNINGKKERRGEFLRIITELPKTNKIIPPRTKIERQIWKIWSELLGTDDFGVTDSFLACGGDSIKLYDLLRRTQEFSYFAPEPLCTNNLTVEKIANNITALNINGS